MGLIHSRAAKKRDKAQAGLAKAEAKAIKGQASATEAEQKAELRAAHVQAHLDGTYPKWRLTPMENVMLKAAQKED